MIVGAGLVLRLPCVADAQRWFELTHDPDQLRVGTPAFVALPESVEAMAGRIAKDLADGVDPLTAPGTFVIGAEDRPELFLGTMSWRHDVPPALQVADVGYGVHPDARGNGVAGRALGLMFDWLCSADGPAQARVQLDHSVENPASCRVALTAGFAREGIRPGFLPMRDDSVPGGVRRHTVCLHGRLAG